MITYAQIFSRGLRLLAVAGLSLGYAGTASAQRVCGADYNQAYQSADTQTRQRMDAVQQQTAAYSTSGASSRSATDVVTIPVVVHVVYNTTAQNLSDAQIQSQIAVLNEDFRLLNADRTNIPSAFSGLASDLRLQFVLATRDPNGNVTTGITRTATSATSFAYTSGYSQAANPVKFTSSGGRDAWPRDKYLNMWVCNLSGSLLGYATFPGAPDNVDGVVCDFAHFGRDGSAVAPFHKGRTATHEVGHWLNLFHIWGDDGSACTGSDQVTDTPNAAGSNTGCPTFPRVTCSNGPNGDMFMNYMDYTDDACMYMFTSGQKNRVDALFAAGGQRESFFLNNSCAENVSVTSSVTTATVFKASNTVTGSSVVSGNIVVTYQAGSQVKLNPGFSVAAGSGGNFTAKIAPCTTSSRVGVLGEAALAKDAAEAGLTAFPNPTSGLVKVMMPQPRAAGAIQVFDLFGKKVYQAAPSPQEDGAAELDLRHLPSGVYVIKVNQSGVVTNKKILLTR